MASFSVFPSSRYTPWQRGLLAAGITGAVALGAALLSQIVGGLHPCEICLWQRYPYAAIIVIASVGFFLPVRLQRLALGLCVLLLLTEFGLALYHAGVEQHWWVGPGCSSADAPTSLDALRASIAGAALVRCDVPGFTFLGLSMAAWNALYALSCVLVIAILFRARKPGA